MADVSAAGMHPPVALAAGRRGRPKNWAQIALLAVCTVIIAWSIASGDGTAFMIAASIGVSQVTALWLWDHRSDPDRIRGHLVVPERRWWQDTRCTVSFRSNSVVIRRAVESEAWDVPWTAVDRVEVTRRRRSRLTLVMDGTPLAEICSVIHSTKMVSSLAAAGLAELE